MHITAVILHHCQVAHAGKHHKHTLLPCRKADGIAGIGAAIQTIENFFGILGKIDQAAALHRLHDDHRLAVLPADLQALPGLNRFIFKIHIVQLQLHHLDLGICRENFLQHLRPVMEGDAEIPEKSLLLHSQSGFVSTAALIFGKGSFILGMHQIEIKIVYPAGFQLLLKQGTNVLLFFKKVHRQLVGQNIPVPGIPGGQTSPEGCFAFAVQIAMGGIEIVKAHIQEGIHHLGYSLQIHFLPNHWKPHTAKA